MKDISCCFSGHRVIPPERAEGLNQRLYAEIESLYSSGIRIFRNGGALGFDMAAALVVIDLKQKYSDLQLYMDLPCQKQASGWSNSDKSIYDYVLDKADKITYVSPYYYNGCMLARNRYMVERSSCLIAYKTRETGGTAYTVRYAASQGLRIILL